MERFRALARRLRHGRTIGYYDVPRGDINLPLPGSVVPGDVVQVLGWCLFPGSTVARVEVAVGDAPPERARLGMPRPDVAERCAHPSAPVCGFELLVRVPPGAHELPVRAVGHSADGRAVEIGPISFIARDAPAFSEESRAAQLRERSTRYGRAAHVAPSREGLRAVVFTHQLPYGGASLYLLETLRRLTATAGFECVVVTLEDGPLRAEFEASGIPVHVTDPCPVTSLARYEGSVAQMLAWAAPQHFDVALVNTVASFQGADVAARLGIPAVWMIHESFDLPYFFATGFERGAVDPYVPVRAEQALADADAVVFEAEATRRLYLPYTDADRLITLPYGIELDAVKSARAGRTKAEARAALGLPQDARVLLCLGTIEPRKSQGMLVEAFAALAARHSDAVLALVGESGAPWCAEYTEGVRAFVARNGLEGRVRVEPVVADPYPWHVAADFHVCASDVESLPRSVLEAMAFGTPVVSTRVFGVPEVLEDGRTGYLCQVRDAAALTAALDRALSAPAAELARIRRGAEETVAERHEPAAYAERLWQLIVAAADEPRAAAERAAAGA